MSAKLNQTVIGTYITRYINYSRPTSKTRSKKKAIVNHSKMSSILNKSNTSPKLKKSRSHSKPITPRAHKNPRRQTFAHLTREEDLENATNIQNRRFSLMGQSFDSINHKRKRLTLNEKTNQLGSSHHQLSGAISFLESNSTNNSNKKIKMNFRRVGSRPNVTHIDSLNDETSNNSIGASSTTSSLASYSTAASSANQYNSMISELKFSMPSNRINDLSAMSGFNIKAETNQNLKSSQFNFYFNTIVFVKR